MRILLSNYRPPNLAGRTRVCIDFVLAGVHGSRTHPGRVHRPATVLKTERPTGTFPLPALGSRNQDLETRGSGPEWRLVREGFANVVIRGNGGGDAVADGARHLSSGGLAHVAGREEALLFSCHPVI